MPVKTGIVEHLGETAVLLPDLLAQALSANDRAKLRMTLLQEAAAHAHHPGTAPRSLEAELHAAGMDDPALVRSVREARLTDSGDVIVPGAQQLIAGVENDIDAMIEPFTAAGSAQAEEFARRLKALALGDLKGDTVSDALITRLTSAQRDSTDTAHLLVMDLHKALNRLSGEIAVETLAGAHVLHIADDDRPRIEAFMRGIERTHKLAFGHPGLGATAARNGERLVIQNDIGTTDAHVIIIAVEAGKVTITYTDVHLRRAKFFISLFQERDMEWAPLTERKARGLADDAAFYLVTGTYTSHDEEDCQAFLDYLGSRLVFLIDWNKARKALQPFVSKAEAVRLLRDAAAGDYGHRGFLELGGAQILFDAIQRSAEGRIPYGTRLDTAMGAPQASALMKRVLRLASAGLLQNRSVRLLQDEVRAELAQCIVSVAREVLAVVLRQLGLARGLASMVQDALGREGGLDHAACERLSRRAKRLEAKADTLALQGREMADAPVGRGKRLLPLINGVENAADDFEEAAFLLSAAPDAAVSSAIARPLADLARTAVECCGHVVRAVEAAMHVPAGNRYDMADALEGVEETLQAERRADSAQRAAMSGFLTDIDNARALVIGTEAARAIENATDHLARSALALRQCVLDDLTPWDRA